MSVNSASDPLDERAQMIIGRELAHQRRLAGMTGSELATRARMSQSKISRIENGRTPFTREEVLRLATALGLSAETSRRMLDPVELTSTVAVESLRPNDLGQRQQLVGRSEFTSRELRVFSPYSVAGLLQTSEYARAILLRFYRVLETGDDDPEEPIILDAVATRLGRQRVLADPERSFSLVMSESVLNNRYCPPTQMLAQLQRIREVAKQHDNVTIAFVPSNVDAPPGSPSIDIHDASRVLVDLPHSAIMITDVEEIAIYRRLFDAIEESATTDIDPILDKYLDMYYELARPHRD